MHTYNVPALSIAIAIHGELAYVEAFGAADREAGEVLTPQHRFRIASVTKPLTSTGILRLLEVGRLQLSSRIFGTNSILGEDYPTPSGRSDIEQITLDHLLTHTAGGWSNDPGNDPMFSNNEMDHKELITWTLQSMPLAHHPGSFFAYSNFGYCLLGRVIEKLTGQTYEQYMQEHVLRPCGISGMRIAGNTLQDRAPLEVKYYSQTQGDPYAMNVARMDSHGGWIATPTELTAVFNHIDGFNDTRQLLSDNTLRIMTTPTAANPRYARGLFVNSLNNWWHPGLLDGTETISVRTYNNFCWSAFTNTRSKSMEMSTSLDMLVWHMVNSVAEWHV
jgi:CubicO group peptidase (beta-lactamase class C family)